MTESMRSTYSVGQQLKKARQVRNLTIEQVTQATHIRAYAIDALEDDNFDALPSPVQARGFLRLYADYLGLSLDELITNQRGESAETPPEQAGTTTTAIETELAGEEPVEVEVEPEPEAEPAAPETPEPVPVAPRTPTPSQSIFLAIGAELRQRRESLSLTLDEVERHTHVRKHYLQALEAGDFDHLPTSVQARGMLNNYAHFLDLQLDAILLRFAEGLQAQRLERQPQDLESSNRTPGHQKPLRARFEHSVPPSIRRFLSFDLIFGGGLILLLLFFAIWGTSQVIGLRAVPKTEANAPSISDVLLVSPEPGSGTSAAPQTSELITPGTANVPITAVAYPTLIPGHVQVIVIGLERAWVRVTVDGKIELEGRILAGSAYPFDGSERIEVLTGKGSAVRIIYNQTNLGVMGTIGEVVDLIYTPKNVLKPTPTPLPTPTATPRVTPTATRTPTPRYTPTPTAKP
jgi:cytoskeletal protein RodZ